MVILFRPFGFHVPKYFKIIWLSNILVLSVLHEDCSRNVLCARTTFNIYVFIRTTIDLSDANISSTFLEIKIQLVNTPKYNEQYLVSNGCLWPFESPMFSTWSNIFTFAPFLVNMVYYLLCCSHAYRWHIIHLM